MKKLLLTALISIFAFTTPIIAQNQTTRFFNAFDYENLTVDTTVGGVSFGTSSQSVTFTIECASGTDCPIRFTIDGTAPTTTVGMRAVYGQSVTIYAIGNINRFRAIREGGTSAVLNVTYLN